MFGNLPVELLRETIGYIHQPSHLQALCLVSKTVSSVATQFLYRDLVLDFLFNTGAPEDILEVFEAVTMCDGLRFVKTLRIGPIGPEMVALFGRLISRLQDHSLVAFTWDECQPPLDSQLLYIWEHQWNIQSISFIDRAHTAESIKPWEGLKFPQKYVDISFKLPLEDDFLAKFDLSCMRSLTMAMKTHAEKLPSCISANMVHITNLQLWFVPLEMDIQLDRITTLVSLGLYSCDGTSSILSDFTNPKLKEFRVEFEEDGPLQDGAIAQISFIKGFHGLETLMVYLPDQSLLKNLMDAISTAHNGTLRNLALLDYSSKDRLTYINGSEGCRDSVYDAVMACPRLVKLEIPTGWGSTEMDFKRIIYNLPLLKFLCFRTHPPEAEGQLPGIVLEENWIHVLTCEVAAKLIRSIAENSSKLRLLSFDMRGFATRLCFRRGWSHGSPLERDCPLQISEFHVKYHYPEYGSPE